MGISLTRTVDSQRNHQRLAELAGDERQTSTVYFQFNHETMLCRSVKILAIRRTSAVASFPRTSIRRNKIICFRQMHIKNHIVVLWQEYFPLSAALLRGETGNVSCHWCTPPLYQWQCYLRSLLGTRRIYDYDKLTGIRYR
jgi:hypothetical protein